MRIQFKLDADETLLAEAYARDRGIPIHNLARSALLSALKRDLGRSHVVDAVRVIVQEELAKHIDTGDMR